MTQAATFRLLCLAASVTAALSLPAGARAELRSAYDLHQDEWALASFAASSGVKGSSSLTAADGGYAVPTGPLPITGAWSVALTVTPSSGDTTLMRVGRSTLSLVEGVTEWTHNAVPDRGDGAPAPAGTAVRIVVSRSAGVVRVYRDKTPVHVVEDGGTDLEGLWVTGDAGRIRVFDHALGEDEALALRPADGQAPGPVTFGHARGTYADGPDLWVGRRGLFALGTTDDGTGPVDVELAVAPRGGLAVSSGEASSRSAVAVGNEEIDSQLLVPFDLGALDEGQHGEELTVAGSVADRVGNETAFTRPIRLDLRAPEGLTVDLPAETTDRSPRVGGAATVGPRDHLAVSVVVCRGDTCDPDPADEVAFGGGPVENGRWSTPGLYRWEGDRPEPVAVGSLPLGTYTFRASHGDYVENHAAVDRVVRIVAPAPHVDPPVAPPTLLPGPPLADTFRPSPPAPRSPSALLARARQAVLAALLSERLRGWLKDGRVDVPVAVDQPAALVVQVFDGAAPAKVDPKARASAAARRRLIGTGRRAFRAAGSGKVAVRLSRRGRSLLKGRRSRRVSVRTIVVPRGGKPVAVTQRLTLKR